MCEFIFKITFYFNLFSFIQFPSFYTQEHFNFITNKKRNEERKRKGAQEEKT